jgi:hypothetical protein
MIFSENRRAGRVPPGIGAGRALPLDPYRDGHPFPVWGYRPGARPALARSRREGLDRHGHRPGQSISGTVRQLDDPKSDDDAREHQDETWLR